MAGFGTLGSSAGGMRDGTSLPSGLQTAYGAAMARVEKASTPAAVTPPAAPSGDAGIKAPVANGEAGTAGPISATGETRSADQLNGNGPAPNQQLGSAGPPQTSATTSTSNAVVQQINGGSELAEAEKLKERERESEREREREREVREKEKERPKLSDYLSGAPGMAGMGLGRIGMTVRAGGGVISPPMGGVGE
jgi:hypothetical protein